MSYVLGSLFRDRWVNVGEAVAVLGRDSAISFSEASQFWKRKVKEIRVPYSREQVDRCASENSRGARWVLVGECGLSPIAIRKEYPDLFETSSVWDTKARFMRERSCRSYRLINFGLLPTVMNGELEKMPAIRHATVATVVEAFVLFKHLRNRVLLEPEASHTGIQSWGTTPFACGTENGRVLVYTLAAKLVHDLVSRRQGGDMFKSVYYLKPQPWYSRHP